MIQLTRCYRFPAAHVLCHDSFTPEENQRVFGKCANPGGHGHNYGLEVTVAGEVDELSGEVMSRPRLDAVVEERVLRRFGHRMLNDDDLFRDCVPTAENVARVIYERLVAAVEQGGGPRLVRVRIHETRRNSFVYGDTT